MRTWTCGLLLLVVLVSCSPAEHVGSSLYEELVVDYKEIVVNGIGESREVSSSDPIILVVNGQNNDVAILSGTRVVKVVVNGQNNRIQIPAGESPEVVQNGIGNQIVYV